VIGKVRGRTPEERRPSVPPFRPPQAPRKYPPPGT